MKNLRPALKLLGFILVFALAVVSNAAQEPNEKQASPEQTACRALMEIPNLTVLSADLVDAKGSTPRYCHVTGLIGPAIHWHMQLPLPDKWNGRLLNIGNNGKAGNITYADNRLAQGYAVANSNTGHDNGSEPNSSFAFNNKQEEIDYGYRAVHLTANASKTLVNVYYSKAPQYSYWEGCSTGGRQGMMEAERYPYDFDGIVAGAPVIDFTKLNAAHIWTLEHLMKDHYAGNLAFDSAGDGSFKSLTKLNILRDAILAKCDTKDGIKDGIIDDPRRCDFNPDVDLAGKMCPVDKNADGCFTRRQIQTIKALYSGPRDSKGNRIYGGLSLGSEAQWPLNVVPYAGNNLLPTNLLYEIDHANYLFYDNSPGVAPPDIKDLSYPLQKKGVFPEYAWWEFNFDDITAGKLNGAMKIIDATDPDLTRLLKKKNAKLLMYQGWGDGDSFSYRIIEYYDEMVKTTFHGDMSAAQEKARLFMVPGMGHCGGGPGPNEWDKLSPLVTWVEKSTPPDSIVAVHRSNVRDDPQNHPVDNERKLCPYPQHAVYAGPAGGQDDPRNWVQANFSCKAK